MDEVFSANIHTECVNGINFLNELIPKVKDDRYNWKWVIIALHNSCQNYMAAALTNTNGLNAMPIKIAKKWVQHFEENSNIFPDDKLDYFCSLYAKIKSNLMMQYALSTKFTPKGNEDTSIKQINEIRNNFIHYTPQMQYNLVVNNLPTTCLDILNIIKFLALESGNIYWYISDTDRDALRLSIENAIISMKDLQVFYN